MILILIAKSRCWLLLLSPNPTRESFYLRSSSINFQNAAKKSPGNLDVPDAKVPDVADPLVARDPVEGGQRLAVHEAGEVVPAFEQ